MSLKTLAQCPPGFDASYSDHVLLTCLSGYTCALQKDILYQGRMFVSDHWICFHSKVFGKDTKVLETNQIAIPVVSVTQIKKTKTAILVPNALVIATANDRYVFVSLLSRDNTYKFLMSICFHLEEKSPCSSPIPSSAENSFRGQRSPLTPRFPLSFSGDFMDLDGAVRQRRQEMEESSSSDSQTPDYDKMAAGSQGDTVTQQTNTQVFVPPCCRTGPHCRNQDQSPESRVRFSSFFFCVFITAEFPVPPFLDAMKQTDRVAPPPEPQAHQHKVKVQLQNQHQNQQQQQQSSDNKQHEGHRPNSEVMLDSRSLKPGSLSTLLFVYLFLVCVLVLSSCYLAFKIVSLEQTLTTLGSVSEFTTKSEFMEEDKEGDLLRGANVNTEFFSELLTINLMKLEKVQKTLQKLLDEAS
ncbi:hypothetical protein INR49_011523 [Caranx melampygus]|nr:hypothetical protein INR49_011523 [Caranx melampygus]